MTTILYFGGIILFVIFLWVCVSLVVHLFLLMFDLFDSVRIKFKIPKSKKYLIKVDPIYELVHDHYDEHYSVRKWSLSYEMNENFPVLNAIIFPWPIEPQIFKYHIEGSYYLCDMNKLDEITEDLETLYNRFHQKWLDKEEKDKQIRDAKENKIKELNKIFDENYE